jgi:hypothetical protein
MAKIAGAASQTDKNTTLLAIRTVTCLQFARIAQEAMFFSHKGICLFPFIRSEALKGEWNGAKLNVRYVSMRGVVSRCIYPHLSLSAE